MNRSLRLFSAAVLGFCLWAAPAFANKSPEERRAEIREMRADVLTELYKEKPATEAQIRKAAGYAVFSNVGINVIFASVAGGHGVVVDAAGKETFMKMGSAGIGIGLGVKDFRAVFVFHTQQRLQDFIDKGWDFSAQAEAAAQSDDKGGQAGTAGSIGEDIEVYQFTKNGLAAQATLQGTKYWRDDDLN